MPDHARRPDSAEPDPDATIETLTDQVARLEDEARRLAGRLDAPAALLDALIESETRYRTIFESEPACVKLVANDGALLSMNPAGLAMIEADHEEQVMGLSVYDLVRPGDREAFISMNERVFAGVSARLEFEIEGLKGTRRQMETFAAPLSDEHGTIVAQLAVTHDITERNREHAELEAYRERLEALVAERTRELEASREEARRVERLASLGTLAAGLAHELNNPLGTILLGADMVGQASDEETRAYALARIRDDVARCAHIVKSMLRFGHDESSDKFPVSMNQVVRTARDNTRELVDRHHIRLRADLAPDLPLLLGNATELGQVLINLVQNAIVASPDGGEIVVATRLEEDRVVCSVEDHGCGMSPEVRDRARDPFFTTRLASGGTGLGLSVSHGIVSDHGGALTIESREGDGTKASIGLPAIEPEERGVPDRG